MAVNKEVSVTIPDSAIEYIVGNYLKRKSVEGVPVVVGISTDDVTEVLSLLVDWAAANNYIRDGLLIIGGDKLG